MNAVFGGFWGTPVAVCIPFGPEQIILILILGFNIGTTMAKSIQTGSFPNANTLIEFFRTLPQKQI